VSNRFPSARHVCHDATTSNLTGRPWFTGDFAQMTVSVETQTNAASRYTVIATNDDGLRAPLGTPSQTVPAGNWSILTVITVQGLYALDPYPGFRWVNVFRPSASTATVTLAVRT
jgi:hypothetical protein